ncbi:F-box DNA helicase 1 isoform X2 [Pogona vitticeps]
MRRFKKVHLTASECEALSQSQEGIASLTQPFRPGQSGRNSHRSLYPTPRRKKHPRGTSGAGRQSCITDYFRRRSASSRCLPDMSRIRKIKAEEPLESFRPQDEELLSDEDSCSLLEGYVAPETSRKRPCFSPRNHHSHTGDGQWDPRNQGFSECLLGDGNVHQEADGVDIHPLPDVYFGLLGTKNWDVPRGSMDQLPDEVLQEIFALMPVVDLYRSLSLVCHRWHRIISDPQFIPWKKLYHQYTREEAGAVSNVMAILEQYGLCRVQNQPILGFIRCVAALKSQRCRDPEAILQCLRSHSLFPMAELCVTRRLPNMQSPQVSYVWAVISTIVLLSGSVREIQELAGCLQSPSSALSPRDVMEALYCMATLLFAMRVKEVLVNNRIHYNIFYCLYLLENSNWSPAIIMPESSNAICERRASRPEIRPTSEQQQILNHAIKPKQVVKIMAFAGTGKTSTLIKYAEKWSNLKFLYLAFNKTIAEQGLRAFPRNVTCKTVHSLAFAEVGRNYRQKGKLNLSLLSSYWVSMALQNREGQSLFIRGKTVLQTLSTFFASADDAITEEHTPLWCKNTKGERVPVGTEEKRIIVEEASLLWDNMKKLTATREMAYKMTHDGYLKLWQLQKPSLSAYDAIFVDEAQDCTPAIMDIVLSQPCGVILVGDPHQQIYTFRGAVNALSEVPHTHIFYLTQSFRFGPEIAYVGATILDVCKKVRNKTLVGSNQEGDVTGVGVTGKVARLSRNNQTVFEDAVSVTNEEVPVKIHILGGLTAFGLEKIHDVWKLLHPEENLEVQDPFFRRWVKKGFGRLKDYAVKAEDKQLEMKIAIVEKYRDRIPELVERISRHHVPGQEMADCILGTVHKAKGLEFDTVQVADDFVNVPFARHNLRRLSVFRTERVPEDEWNLLYVAVTRAKRRLIMPKGLTHLLTLAGEYYLQPELTSKVCADVPVQCSVRGCCNSIPTESFLTMKKKPFVYSDGTRGSEGFLCHACVEQRLGPLVGLTASPEVVQGMDYAEEALDFPQVVLFLLEHF